MRCPSFLFAVIPLYKNCIITYNLNVAPINFYILCFSECTEKALSAADYYCGNAARAGVKLHITYCADFCAVANGNNILVAEAAD